LLIDSDWHVECRWLDSGSIMHYDAFAFAKDRRFPTITAKKKGEQLGQRNALSMVGTLAIY
jgi:hypothetical protein